MKGKNKELASNSVTYWEQLRRELNLVAVIESNDEREAGMTKWKSHTDTEAKDW
jgi:hypothetical protein